MSKSNIDEMTKVPLKKECYSRFSLNVNKCHEIDQNQQCISASVNATQPRLHALVITQSGGTGRDGVRVKNSK